MKIIKLFLSFILLLIVYTANAQTAQRGFSYQGYAVTSEGVALSEEHINVRFTVYPKSGGGDAYEEEQRTITDFYGIFNAMIGEQTPALFQKMNFTAKNADFWLKVEVKKLADQVYTKISDAEMLSVPYARYADNGVPVGTIISFGAGIDQIPEGWLFCDGTQYDGTLPQYQQLYNTLENTWGGTGTNFNVPELRGYFLRGFDGGTGNDPDAVSRTGGEVENQIGSYQIDTMPTHNHHMEIDTETTGAHTHTMSQVSYAYGIGGGANGLYVIYNADGAFVSSTHPLTNTTGNHDHTIVGDSDNNLGSAETRPKNAAVLYIIKY